MKWFSSESDNAETELIESEEDLVRVLLLIADLICDYSHNTACGMFCLLYYARQTLLLPDIKAKCPPHIAGDSRVGDFEVIPVHNKGSA